MSKILQIQLKKGRDGPHTLVYARVDGSITMQRDRTGFFPMHDLTHFAVESVLKHRRGFFGLLAQGWDIGDFGRPWPRGPLPADAEPAEQIVGLFDIERRNSSPLDAVEFNNALTSANVHVSLTDEQLNRIRACLNDLEQRWNALQPGETLQLLFTADE
jgi:hypothetical protein